MPMDRGEGQQWSQAPGNLYSTPQTSHVRSAQGRHDRDRARQGDPADRSAEGHEVRQARADPERAPDEVLGPADAPRRERAAARRLGHASRRALSALHLPRPLPVHVRRVAREQPPDPNAQARLRRALPTGRATTASSRSTRTSSTRSGPARTSRARSSIEIQHADAVLRRLLRGELGEHRPVRRRDRAGAASLHREEVPRPRRRAGRASCTADRPAAGRRWRAQMFYPDVVQRRLHRLSRSDRLPRLHRRRYLQGQERVLPR